MTRKMKDSGIEWIGMIPEGWDVVSIGRIFNISAGGDTKTDYYSDVKDKQHPYPVYTNSMFENQVYAYTSNPVFDKNTITVTGRGSIGRAFYRDTPYDAIIRLLSLSPKFDLDSRFYAYWIDNVIHFSTDSSAVGQLSAIQMTTYKTVSLSKSEQQRIVSYLDAKCAEIDALMAANDKTISQLREYRQSIIFEAVTGKVEV